MYIKMKYIKIYYEFKNNNVFDKIVNFKVVYL